jgi:hypothetical protein
MTEQRDKGGSLVTDYSRSPIAPDRARKLNMAELDYVNGCEDPDAPGEIWWPSYPELAAKYEMPVRVINEQASKHRWVSRREQRKTAMIAFKNEQTRKQWLDMDREVMGETQKTLYGLTYVAQRIGEEYIARARKAVAEENARKANGEEDAIVLSGIRPAELESTARTIETLVKTAERLAGRIQGLPTVLPEILPPKLIQTVEQEEQERVAEDERILPKATLLDVVRELRAIEESRRRLPIVGEVVYDDGDDEEIINVV